MAILLRTTHNHTFLPAHIQQQRDDKDADALRATPHTSPPVISLERVRCLSAHSARWCCCGVVFARECSLVWSVVFCCFSLLVLGGEAARHVKRNTQKKNKNKKATRLLHIVHWATCEAPAAIKPGPIIPAPTASASRRVQYGYSIYSICNIYNVSFFLPVVSVGSLFFLLFFSSRVCVFELRTCS